MAAGSVYGLCSGIGLWFGGLGRYMWAEPRVGGEISLTGMMFIEQAGAAPRVWGNLDILAA